MSARIAACVLGAAVFWTAVVWPSPAHATPVQWSSGTGANSHYYEFVQVVFSPDFSTDSAYAVNTWAAAQAAAAASSAGTGYLATVTSVEENAFLVGLLPSSIPGLPSFAGAWLGGEGVQSPSVGVTWTVGPGAPFAGTFLNWASTEPNNSPGTPGGMLYMGIGTDPSRLGKWFDDSVTNGTPDATLDPVIGYFVEYDSVREAAPVPEPATMSLLGLGLGLGAAVRRRRSRPACRPSSPNAP